MGKLYICKINLVSLMVLFTPFEHDRDTLHVHYPSLLAGDSYL